jgi:N-methylhydantoinase A
MSALRERDLSNLRPRRGRRSVTYTISADIGGTFTDVALADESGRIVVGKAPTTPERSFLGLHAALDSAAGLVGLDVEELLRSASLFVYATTRGMNAMLEGQTAKTALLITAGHTDVLVRREGGKQNPFDFTDPPPPPYVPRRLTFGVEERVDAEGEVVVPLDGDPVRELLRRLEREGVEAVGVCLLWSIVNPAHELAIGRLIDEELPGIPYTLSHQLNPIIREYRRASATAIDASLKPVMQSHLQEIASNLRGAGFGGELYAATSAGGVTQIHDLSERPIYSINSGPSLAPVAAMTYAALDHPTRDVIVCDMGGTSFDVSLIRDAAVVFTREKWFGPELTGHLTGLSSVDVRSIGAGGGSIAWVDSGGLLRVGPQSAGADPGPACYGRGGTAPTVTDAAAVLGYLDPSYFLGGEMTLDVEAGERAVNELAATLGLGIPETALAILAVANERMINAIKDVTVSQGIDPRESLLVGGGGAAGLTIVPIARELGCREVLIPRTAGALSACGAQYSDIKTEDVASAYTTTASFDFARVNAALESIREKLDTFAAPLVASGLTKLAQEFFVDARYPDQAWEIELRLAGGRFDDAADVQKLRLTFHDLHKRLFAVSQPDQDVECLHWTGRLTASLKHVPLAAESNGGGPQPATPIGERTAYFPDVGAVSTPVYKGPKLAAGTVIPGPAVIEEPTTTLVLDASSSACVTAFGNYLIDVKAA